MKPMAYSRNIPKNYSSNPKHPSIGSIIDHSPLSHHKLTIFFDRSITIKSPSLEMSCKIGGYPQSSISRWEFPLFHQAFLGGTPMYPLWKAWVFTSAPRSFRWRPSTALPFGPGKQWLPEVIGSRNFSGRNLLEQVMNTRKKKKKNMVFFYEEINFSREINRSFFYQGSSKIRRSFTDTDIGDSKNMVDMVQPNLGGLKQPNLGDCKNQTWCL